MCGKSSLRFLLHYLLVSIITASLPPHAYFCICSKVSLKVIACLNIRESKSRLLVLLCTKTRVLIDLPVIVISVFCRIVWYLSVLLVKLFWFSELHQELRGTLQAFYRTISVAKQVSAGCQNCLIDQQLFTTCFAFYPQ